MWIEWTIATRFLREGKAQSVLILVGIAVGVAVIVFLTALITGLHGNIINRTLGTQAHIKVQPTEETNRLLAPADGSVQLVLEDRRAQRLRSINNWQQVRDVLDTLPQVTAMSPYPDCRVSHRSCGNLTAGAGDGCAPTLDAWGNAC